MDYPSNMRTVPPPSVLFPMHPPQWKDQWRPPPNEMEILSCIMTCQTHHPHLLHNGIQGKVCTRTPWRTHYWDYYEVGCHILGKISNQRTTIARSCKLNWISYEAKRDKPYSSHNPRIATCSPMIRSKMGQCTITLWHLEQQLQEVVQHHPVQHSLSDGKW